MSVRILQVDSFTNRAFAGNPAAVCLLETPAEEAWMQHVAAEMNLSETAFVHPIEAGPVFRLRWFTPSVEVDLCGHATLAAAHVLWEEGLVGPESPALFETRSGRLSAERRDGWIALDFPSEPVAASFHEPAELEKLAAALHVPVRSAGGIASTCWSSSPTRRPSEAAAGHRPAPGIPRPRRDRHQPIRVSRLRFRLSLLRAPGRHRRGSRLRLGSLLPRPLLGGETGPQRADRPPGLPPRWRGQGPGERVSRRPHRPGRHRAQGRARERNGRR